MSYIWELDTDFSSHNLRCNSGYLYVRFVVDKVEMEEAYSRPLLIIPHLRTDLLLSPTCVMTLTRQHIITGIIF